MKRRNISQDTWDQLFTILGTSARGLMGAGGTNVALNNNVLFLSNLYSRGSFWALVIDIVVDEITRNGFTISDDPELKLPRFLDEIGAFTARAQAVRFARIFGGSVSVMYVNDGRDSAQPLNEATIKSFNGIQVYDRFRVSWAPNDLYKDTKNPRYGYPEIYTISPVWAPQGAVPIRVHESRCLVLDGEPVSDYRRIDNYGWGDSELVRILGELSALAEGNVDVGKLLRTLVTNVIGIPGLMQMIMEGESSKIQERILLARETLERSGFWLLDRGDGTGNGETMEKMTTQLSGAIQLPQNQQAMVAAVARIPQSRLFGRSPAGMNSTGEGEENNFTADIEGLRNSRMRPWDTRLAKVSILSGNGPAGDHKVITVIYPPLKQESAKERLEGEKNIATTAKTLVDIGAIHGDEVRQWAGSLPYVKLDDTKYGDPTTRPKATFKPDPNVDPEADPNAPGKKEKKPKAKPAPVEE